MDAAKHLSRLAVVLVVLTVVAARAHADVHDRHSDPQSLGKVSFADIGCALVSARSDDAASARRGMERLEALREALITAKQGYWAGQAEIQIKVAAAWVARAEGREQESVSLLREAADMEDATEKDIVTPGHLLPARDLLGDLLLELGQPAQALKEFEASVEKEPNRFGSLYGAARAAELYGNRTKAKTYYAKLIAIAEKADGARPELERARTYLAQR